MLGKSSRISLFFHDMFCSFVPFWSEFIWVWPVLGVAVQGVRWDENNGVFWNGHPIYFHIFLAVSLNPSSEGVEPEGFIHGHVKVIQLHYRFICERSLWTVGERWSGMSAWGLDFPKMSVGTSVSIPFCPSYVSNSLKSKMQGRNCFVGWVFYPRVVKMPVKSHPSIRGCKVWQTGLCRALVCKASAAKRKPLQGWAGALEFLEYPRGRCFRAKVIVLTELGRQKGQKVQAIVWHPLTLLGRTVSISFTTFCCTSGCKASR